MDNNNDTAIEVGIRAISKGGTYDVVNIRYYGMRDRFYVDTMHKGEYLTTDDKSLMVAIENMINRIKQADARPKKAASTAGGL